MVLTRTALASAIQLRPPPPTPRIGSARLGLVATSATTLLDLVNPGPDSRVVLVGPGSLDLGCALMKAGAAEIAFVRLGECPRDMKADIVIVPHPPCLDAALRSVVLGGRMLAQLGTVAFGRLETSWVPPLCAVLRAHGFDRVQSWAGMAGVMLRAEMPLHGRLSCG